MTARHGLITSLTLHAKPPPDASQEMVKTTQQYLDALALSLVGKRYESLDDADETLPGDDEPVLREVHTEVIDWLRRAM